MICTQTAAIIHDLSHIYSLFFLKISVIRKSETTKPELYNSGLDEFTMKNYFFLLTASFNAEPAEKAGTLVAAILITSPVLGLRP